jgi:hypothetical protein
MILRQEIRPFPTHHMPAASNGSLQEMIAPNVDTNVLDLPHQKYFKLDPPTMYTTCS